MSLLGDVLVVSVLSVAWGIIHIAHSRGWIGWASIWHTHDPPWANTLFWMLLSIAGFWCLGPLVFLVARHGAVGLAVAGLFWLASAGLVALAFVARRRHWFGVYVPSI